MMPRDGVKVEVIVRETPEASPAWSRLFDWLLSKGGNDPDEPDHQGREERKDGLRDFNSA